METNTPNIYLFKAMDAYPYELEKAIEALNYALSYEPENVKALCLMAKVYCEQLGDYEAAISYYERALTSRMDIPEVYPDYIRILLMNDDYDKAQKLIDFAYKVKGIDLAGIHLAQGILFETKQDYEKAEVALKDAKQFGLNNHFTQHVDGELKRVRKKLKVQKRKVKSVTKLTKNEQKATTPNKNWLRNRLNSLL